jgi:hypothetical protein
LPMNRGIKNNPKVNQAGSLAFTSHTSFTKNGERNSPLRTLTKFTNSPIYKQHQEFC